MVAIGHLDDLLQQRAGLTAELLADCYSIRTYLSRSEIHEALGYPDLAAFDAYKALLLVDEVSDEGFEYHEAALDSLVRQCAVDQSGPDGSGSIEDICASYRLDCALRLANNLLALACLRPAYEYFQQALRVDPANPRALALCAQIKDSHRRYGKSGGGEDSVQKFSAEDLPDLGFVRREVYPWNEHESSRTTADALDSLNAELALVAPKLEVKVTELPLLHDHATSTGAQGDRMVRQLGVFAKEDIQPGEEILRERSLLTANARLHEPLCDACNAPLPDLGVQSANSAHDEVEGPPVPCPDCDVVFCSQECHDLADASYHPTVCGTDVEIQKDVPPARAAEALYTLLLSRALAMARTQDLHPLDLKEVKYIWGDFSLAAPDSARASTTSTTGAAVSGWALFAARPHTLPFTFDSNVLAPLHMLEKMDVDIFAPGTEIAELWVWNTLLAKFRGTASARIGRRDGRPEVAAVHPLWCLANHSCDPNVTWEWAGEITFEARRSRARWARSAPGAAAAPEESRATEPGIRRGEEVLNHYVDVELGVEQRRDWGSGPLGGLCMCDRCVWEAAGVVSEGPGEHEKRDVGTE